MKPHKWAKEIKAWADGAEIQIKRNNSWCTESWPSFDVNYEYRIKPQPKEPQYLYVYNTLHGIEFDTTYFNNDGVYIGKIKLETEE